MAHENVRGPRVLDVIENNVRVMGLHKVPRYQELRHQQAFYYGRHHDHQRATWDGSHRDPGVNYMRERLHPQGFVPTNAIPYGARKPDAHAPISRQIVNRFSEMLLGQNRQPHLQVPSDEKTEAYLNAIFEEAEMWNTFVEARTIAGCGGAVAIVLAVLDGTPMAEVLNPADLWIAEWEKAPYWQPKRVVEQRMIDKTEITDEGVRTKKYWRTRMWTETHVIHYKDVKEKHEGPIPMDGKPVEHKAGRCPVIWYQNTRNRKSPDGEADYAGVEHLIDTLDRLQSQTCKGAKANIDPTLVVNEERRVRNSLIVRKGTGNVIGLSPAGKVSYLEMQGTSLEIGWKSVDKLESQILQTVECVIVTPETTGAYQSGEALQVLWRSMEAKCNRLRVTLKSAVQQVCRVWLNLGAAHGVANMEQKNGKTGIWLPPRVIMPDAPDDPMEPAKKEDPELETHEVGEGSHVVVRWPPYWSPTPMQLNALSAAMQTASGGASLSKETAIEVMAGFTGVDPTTEKDRVAKEKAAGMREIEASMFPEGEGDGPPKPAAKAGASGAPGLGGKRKDDGPPKTGDKSKPPSEDGKSEGEGAGAS